MKCPFLKGTNYYFITNSRKEHASIEFANNKEEYFLECFRRNCGAWCEVNKHCRLMNRT